MHPIERLRMVARAGDDDAGLVAQEAAVSLAVLVDEASIDQGHHPELVIACRRLVERHPANGPLWWVAARVLAAADPAAEAEQAADDLGDDPTPSALAAHLPGDATVTVLGWPERVGEALARRMDVTALVVDAGGTGAPLVSHLERGGGRARLVPEAKLATAVARSDVLLLEATALGPSGPTERAAQGPSGPTERAAQGPSGLSAAPPSWAAAAVAADAGVDVWAVAGRGRVLPPALWDSLVERTARHDEWRRRDELVPLRLVNRIVGPDGPEAVDDALARADCPPAPELTRPVSVED